MKIFSERHNFKINMTSTRCKFIPQESDICPGKISRCVFPIIFVIIVNAIATQAVASPIQELLRNRIESGGIPLKLSVGEEPVYASVVLPAFYERRIYRPAWINDKGLLPHATSLLNALQTADAEGLRPNDYHWHTIEH
ncbi:MAG: hypothetical protein KJO34_03020, partial [Deltaproteobacteria bacterium]|nr:hypothetical protein [Deltaproteobacteria bacterium]